MGVQITTIRISLIIST